MHEPTMGTKKKEKKRKLKMGRNHRTIEILDRVDYCKTEWKHGLMRIGTLEDSVEE